MWLCGGHSIKMGIGMSYHVFHVTTRKRTRVHDGSCGHCRHGAGHANQRKCNSGTTGWSPPFETLKQAEAYMELQFAHFPDRGRCKRCISGA
jgi:hypothetical protein